MACNSYTKASAYGCPQTTNTYAQCGTGNGGSAPCKGMYNTATEEKGSMQHLNDKLAGFLQRLQGMQSDPQVDPSKYREAICLLENEMTKLRDCYEAELAKLRQALEDCCREKNSLTLNANSFGANLSDLQAKLQNLQAQLQKALGDNQTLCGQLAHKDKETADLRCCLKACQDELDRIKPDYTRLLRDSDGYKQRLECELKAKSDTDCRLKQALDKCQFDNNNKDQHIRELQERIKAAGGIIASLETKIGQLSNNNGGAQIGVLLQKMREGTAAEITRQQQATDNALTISLKELKCQIDTDAKDKDGLLQEKVRLQEIIQQLQTRYSDMEGQLTARTTENQQLKADLARDRACCQQQIQNLEKKLQELHIQMMNKMKECNQARDQQVSLHAEINNYQSLLEAADSKLQQVGPSSTTVQSCTVTRQRSVPMMPPIGKTQSYSASVCQARSPAEVLGSLGIAKKACCGSCATGGACGSKQSQRPTRYTSDQFYQQGQMGSSARVTSDFRPGGYSRSMTGTGRPFTNRPF